jgi:hypothetical protein
MKCIFNQSAAPPLSHYERKAAPQPNIAIDGARELFMGEMPVSGMIGLAVAAGVMLFIGTVQFRKTGV